jgi:Ni,Fe-hydrogenase III large subunit
MPGRVDQFADLLDKNEIVLQRLRNVGIVDEQTLLSLGVTGPLLRATGNPGTCARRSPTRATTTSSSESRSARSATTTTAIACACRR